MSNDFGARPLRVLFLILTLGLLAGCSDDDARAEEHLQRAAAFAAKDDPRSATIELKAALQLQPDNSSARLRLGRIYLEQERGAEALKELERARSLSAPDARLMLDLSRAQVLAGQFQEAMDNARRYGDDDVEWQTLRGEAYLGLQRHDSARTAFEKALAGDPGNTRALRGLARVALIAGETKQAGELLDRAVASDASEVRTWVLKGELEHGQADFAASEASYRKVLELQPGQPVGRLGLARALIAQQKSDEAHEQLTALEQAKVNTPLLHYLKALQARQEGDLEGAERALLEVLKVAPNHAPSQLLMGQISLMQRELDQAQSMLSRYVAQVPENAAGRKLLAAVQIELDQPREALLTLAPLAGSETADAQTLSLLGTAHLKLGDLEKGKRFLDLASQSSPETPAIRTQLAVSHLASGDTEKAAQELQAVIDQDPGFARADFLLVLTRLREGNREAAMEAAQRLVDKHPDSAEAYNLLGAVLESRREVDAARKAYARSMALAPDSRAGALNLARLDLASGNRDGARQGFQDVLDRHPSDVTALMGLARIASDGGDTEEGLRLLERARTANPQAVRPRMVLANYHLRRGAPGEALTVLQELSAEARKAPAVTLLLGRTQLAAGQREAALTTLRTLAQEQPEVPLAHFNLALAEQANGRLDAARAALQRTLELDDDNHLARATLGQLAVRTRRYDEALAIADRLAKDLPDTSASAVLRGDVAFAKGDVDGAVTAYEDGFRRAPNSGLLVKLFLAEQRAGRADDATRRAEAWLEDNPNDSRVRSLLAASLHQTGDPLKVLKHYEKVLETDPRNVVALNNLAWLYYQRADDRALDLAKRAYDLMPARAEVADTYGWLLVESGQVERGLTLIARAYEAAPKNRDIGYHHAAALHRAGERAKARRVLERLLADKESFGEREAAAALLRSLRAN